MVNEEVRKELLKKLKPGQTVYTILRHRSASGMSHEISVMALCPTTYYKGDKTYKVIRPHVLDRLIVRLENGWKIGTHGGIKVGGCGMDMGFHLVYCLGLALWPKGTKKPHGTRNGEPDRDGGYALKQQWL